jgi:hypothetical protein
MQIESGRIVSRRHDYVIVSNNIAYFIYAFDFNLFVLADCMSNAGMGVDLTSSSRKEQKGLKCGLSNLFYYYNIDINIIISQNNYLM